MKKKRFLETKIVSILHQQEAGKSVKDIAREHGISEATFYNWKAKYGGMEISDVKKDERIGRGECQAQTHRCQPHFGK